MTPQTYEGWFHSERRKFLLAMLELFNGNQLAVADAMQVHRNSLKRMMNEDGITKRMIRDLRESLPKFEGVNPYVPTRKIYRLNQGEHNV